MVGRTGRRMVEGELKLQMWDWGPKPSYCGVWDSGMQPDGSLSSPLGASFVNLFARKRVGTEQNASKRNKCRQAPALVGSESKSELLSFRTVVIHPRVVVGHSNVPTSARQPCPRLCRTAAFRRDD